jgi:hypothetical protein
MRIALTLIFLFSAQVMAIPSVKAAPPIKAAPQWSAGLGFQSKFEHDENPDYINSKGLAEIYGSLAYHPWSFLLELSRGTDSSSTGNYAIKQLQLELMGWGRYEPWTEWPWKPFVGAGLGWTLTEIDTTFGSAHDSRWADGGGIFGVNLGLTTVAWDHLNFESEIRVSKYEFEQRAVWGLVFRLGYTF